MIKYTHLCVYLTDLNIVVWLAVQSAHFKIVGYRLTVPVLFVSARYNSTPAENSLITKESAALERIIVSDICTPPGGPGGGGKYPPQFGDDTPPPILAVS